MSDAEPPQTTNGGDGPLAGLVIADFTRVLAGPYATMLLADMGATVIKVEAPSGDDSRQWVPPHRDGVSTYYLSCNRNKQSIVLDLKDDADRAAAYDIIDCSDVLVENFKPGGLARFGLDRSSTETRWPELIHVSITGFGTQGGHDMPGYDLLAQAMSGLMVVTGSSEGPPQRAGVAMFDVITGLHAAVGILGALIERRASGLGQGVELNLLTSALSGLVNQSTGYAACGNVPMRLGNDHPSLFPYGPFAASDREIVICCGNDGQFRRLAQVIDRSWLGADPRFRTMADRNAHRDFLRREMTEALTRGTAQEWFRRLQAEGIPCAPILGVDEGVDFADSIGLNPVVQVGRGEEEVPLIRHPVEFSRTPVHYDKAPPALDQDREDVLRWIGQQKMGIS
ncbi:CaiB/BaiF CoA transferase family protein [Nesterenkonia marinintestina]|uniref:CaiB/BaiF CoA transferase family protein n=1 Tax=Nesterenkonia marinintestina TaxID=2979865 RepID=UPI0021BE5301|nr:CoA transferase [Nesterenkonia sp. GX14115]